MKKYADKKKRALLDLAGMLTEKEAKDAEAIIKEGRRKSVLRSKRLDKEFRGL